MKNRSLNGSMEDITIISSGVKIEGKVTSSGSIRVDGTLQGDLSAKGNVTVGEQGDINGQINANVVNIGGKVVGTVIAKEKLVLESKSSLKGDIISKILIVEAGAKFDGKSSMDDNIKETVIPKPVQSNQ
ncbi:polymer-forming cytoskeletal [bacterium BMS3Abin03]|nr:polymer-forming cytoskeletal [bacterium BMS3Abin03]